MNGTDIILIGMKLTTKDVLNSYWDNKDDFKIVMTLGMGEWLLNLSHPLKI